MLEILRNPTFRRLFAAQIVALMGTGLLTVALGLLAYDLAGGNAGAVLGTALAIKMVAYVGVAPMISAAADRVPRKVLLVGANAARAGIALMLPFVDQPWQIYVLVFALQAASATFTPAFQSVIPAVLVDEGQYTRGLSLSRLAYDLESLLSPALAAALLTVVAYNSLFLGTVIGFAVSALLVRAATLPSLPAPDRSEPFTQRVTAGARVMARSRPLRGLLALNLVVAAATALVVVNTVVYVRGLLGGSNTGAAVALGCFGGGSMAIALLAPRMLASGRDRRMMLAGAAILPVGLAGTSAMLLAGPSSTSGWLALIPLWVALGAGTSLISTPSARLLRAGSTADNRGAVFTAQFSLSHACFLLTYPIAGWLGSASQFAAAATLTALATLAAIAAARFWPANLGSTSPAASAGGIHGTCRKARRPRRRGWPRSPASTIRRPQISAGSTRPPAPSACSRTRPDCTSSGS